MNAGIPMEPEAKVRQRMPKLNQAILEKMKAVGHGNMLQSRTDR